MSRDRKSIARIIQLRSRASVAAGLVVIAFIASTALAARARRSSPPPLPDSVLAGAQVKPTPEEPEEVTLTLRADGFTPAEMTRPAGRFLLTVDNRSGVEELILLLTREDGERVRELRIPPRMLDWNEMIDLPAGHYTLREANHPSWVCRITAQ